MKKIILILSIIFIYAGCSNNTKQPTIIKDGFYLVKKLGNDSTDFGNIGSSEALIEMDAEFLKNDPQDFTKALIDVSDFVPLELEKIPETGQQTESKKILLISLAPEASEKVKDFTEKRLKQQVAIVMDGKAITVHKIRETIIGGKIQITRCDDNACEYLMVKMKNKVKG